MGGGDAADSPADKIEAPTLQSKDPTYSPELDDKNLCTPVSKQIDEDGSGLESDLESASSDNEASTYELNTETCISAEHTNGGDSNTRNIPNDVNEDETITSGYTGGEENSKLGISTSFVVFIASLDISNPMEL